ncbi:hypothetical protein [Liquorilactobacillus oeni]|uniref:Uncharacterized protein n=1 Tax=Liquorilactobacillus oeni DSM 19972 TaxID=1423777 RepID=A0A0R1MK01_9LACO|nr:hypothetical protein [Liquorilactobacillus oeni]KRL05685.1 hypothetical protein FD46_GL000432 [Liquorilactobacillus oeni DSM 19972]
MKIKVGEFIEKVENDGFYKKELPVINCKSAAQFVSQSLSAFFTEFKKNIEKEELVQVKQPILMGTNQILLVLETGIINLPFANTKQVDNFFELNDETQEVVNLVVAADKLNKSGLRIDSFGTVAAFNKESVVIEQKLTNNVLDKLAVIEENAAK